jgi:zinc transport system ATP-binding protein
LDALLRIENLSVTLGGQPILQDVDMTVERGTIHALIGPNGAGKTTMIRSVMGGMPHRGTIKFRFVKDGRIGYVPQLLQFNMTLPITVGDFLGIMLHRRPIFIGGGKKIRSQIERALAMTHTEHLYDRLIGGLSGGELRRVMLAQALVPTPELLVLDEAASNIDQSGVREIEAILVGLRKEQGVTILLVNHDLFSILRTADAATGINRKVTWSGDPRMLCQPERMVELFGASSLSAGQRMENC